MHAYTKPLAKLIEEFAKLPGIGTKTAERLAFHMLKCSAEEAMQLANAVRDLKTKTQNCRICYNVCESSPCEICADASRDQSLICVVEQPRDLVAIEKSGEFPGVYHVLMGRIAPLEGSHPEDLTIGALVERVRAGGIREVVLATNPDLEGDGTALYIAKLLAPLGARVTRPAKGIPAGSQIEYVGKAILSDALRGRQDVIPQ